MTSFLAVIDLKAANSRERELVRRLKISGRQYRPEVFFYVEQPIVADYLVRHWRIG